jgi:hypothetical protein
VDGDGDLDLVIARGRHWPLTDLVLMNDGAGHFAPAAELPGAADRTYTAGLADLDGDGDLDIVSKLWRPRKDNANQGRNHVDLLENLLKQ